MYVHKYCSPLLFYGCECGTGNVFCCLKKAGGHGKKIPCVTNFFPRWSVWMAKSLSNDWSRVVFGLLSKQRLSIWRAEQTIFANRRRSIYISNLMSKIYHQKQEVYPTSTIQADTGYKMQDAGYDISE